MPYRSSPRRARNDVAFAVRIRVRIPREAPKRLTSHIPFWLLSRCGREGFAHRRMHIEAEPLDVVYFHQLEDAQAFMAAFPDLELVNDITSEADTGPRYSQG